MFKKLKKKHIIYASLLIGIFSLFIFCTIAYSAINGTVKISGNAYARAEADTRITDFRLASANNATSSYEEFGKSHIVTEVEFINNSSSISYYVEVSNYGNNSVGIYEITGLPNEISYTIEGYNLKDKICDNSNTCSGFLKQTYKITLRSSSSYTGSIKLDFDFRPFLNITYDGISGNYRSDFIAGDYVSINVGYLDFVYAVGEEEFEYEHDSGVVSFWDAWCNVEIGVVSTEDFSYTGNVQTYKVKADGIYRIELWGASGGSGILTGYNSGVTNPTPGKGAYTSGYIFLEKDTILYIYTGGVGETTKNTSTIASGGFNGGGKGAVGGNDNDAGGGGGGATDVRLIGGNWNDFNSLKSRIMVAAGGGGSNYVRTEKVTLYREGLDAGGLAVSGKISTWTDYWTPIVNQTTGGYFGYGANGIIDIQHGGAGGGSGYYGGYDYSINLFSGSSSGGSSFISWHEGCNAITESSISSNIVHTDQSIHYSGYVFTNTTMIDGAGYKWTDVRGSSTVGMPKTDYSGVMTGNTGNGYAKITPVTMGDYHLIKYKYTNENLSNYVFVKDGEDLEVSFNYSYDDVVVKNKDGSLYNNYSYDATNKRLIVDNVKNDIEVSIVRPFDYENYSYSGGGPEIMVDFLFYNTYDEHYPITVNYYRKFSSAPDDSYELIYIGEVTKDDSEAMYYTDYDTYSYTSYDIKVELIGNNGYKTTVYDTIGTECFVAGTKVLTESGYVNIEEIHVGDYVYALDLNTNERVLKRVERKFIGQSDETFEITVNGNKTIATPKHKFYVIDKGWVRAAELEVGDVLNSLNNGKLEITKIKHVKHDVPVNVYNLTVEDLHNYFVSSDQLLVHNVASSMPD